MLQHVSDDHIKPHTVTLDREIKEDALTLIPLCDVHFPFLVKWNQDREVIRWVETDPSKELTEEEIKSIYITASKDSLCFLIVYQNQPIGECWLQPMNITKVINRHPGTAVGRIDLMIGENDFQNAGIGTMVVEMLTEYASDSKMYEVLYGFMRADNMRSRSVFRKNGYKLQTKGYVLKNEDEKQFSYCCYSKKL